MDKTLPWARMTQYHACDKIGGDEWLIDIKNYVEDTRDKQRIGKVPSMLRKVQSNENCYDPLIVSIGPYHHKKEDLKALEKLKITFANKFHRACGDQVSINQLYEEVANVAESAREFYEEESTKKYDHESFAKMMFLDACFVLQFMCILTNNQPKEEDQLLTMKSYFSAYVWRDLFLLENQIPLLVLKVLLNFRFESKELQTNLIPEFLDLAASIMPPEETSCTNEVKKFVNKFCPHEKKGKSELQLDESPHLLDLMWRHLTGRLTPKDTRPSIPKDTCNAVKKFVNQFRPREKKGISELQLDESRPPPPKDTRPTTPKDTCNAVKKLVNKFRPRRTEGKQELWHSYRTVTELEAAGIYFKASKTHHVTDVDFKDHLVYGTMTLPPLVVDDSTKPLLLNLVAYEMSPNGPSDSHITSYIWLMDSLIDRASDVRELRKKRILVNNLGSDDHLATLFNEIANDLVPDPRAYAEVTSQIEKHWRNNCRVWISEWTHNHFSSPWTVLAFVGAIFALALTMVQTYFSVYPRSK